MFALTLGGYLVFDYRMTSRWAGAEGQGSLSFTEYLGGLSGRVAGLTGAASASGLPTRLADMLPEPPAGWTVRPSVPEDVDSFLPRNTRKADKAALAYVKAVARAERGKGVEGVALTYEKGDTKVLVRATRYPNVIFTSLAATAQRVDLQLTSAAFTGTEFMTVRGLDVTEDILPEGFRARYFLTDVGAQIHIRVLAPKRMSDRDLLAFFETLHVKAMNASVIDTSPGLGEVPVIVLASELGVEARKDYAARIARQEAEETSSAMAALQEAEARAAAAAAAEPASDGGFLSNLFGSSEAAPAEEAKPAAQPGIHCEKSRDGFKRCRVETADE